jgi:hypothetical protein
VHGGVLAAPASALLKDFFAQRRSQARAAITGDALPIPVGEVVVDGAGLAPKP